MELKPKEKAKQLVKRFIKPTLNDFSDENFEQTKECALICVDEIIETKPLEKDYEDHGHRGRETWYNDKTDYWLSVKKEIQAL